MSNKKMNLIDDNKQFRNEADKQSILTKDKKRLKPKLKSFSASHLTGSSPANSKSYEILTNQIGVKLTKFLIKPFNKEALKWKYFKKSFEIALHINPKELIISLHA